MERVYLVIVKSKRLPRYIADESLAEMRELVRTAGGSIVGESVSFIERPVASTYLGAGKLAEIKENAIRLKANLLVFDIDLSATQARNIEDTCGMRVVDRTGIILDIFARRARSKEGKLQVELAQHLYLLPRLTGYGIMLSRLGGGIGTKGPGERKLEYDRRRIRDRISKLKEELEKTRTHRFLVREGRRKKNFLVVALVGYTNAGKTTLLNALTGAEAFAEDKLFATLDPLTRVYEDGKRRYLFTDTVGFLINLPHDLIEAFKATLEEINEADLILHVLDISHPAYMDHKRAVEGVLKDLGVDAKPRVLVLNKADRLVEKDRARLCSDFPNGLLISAKTAEGLDKLLDAVADKIGAGDEA